MENLIDKAYAPSLVEDKIYGLWKKNQLFKINLESNKKTYAIVLPPPNITGVLHMGHALNFTLQDISARFKRMTGFEIVWIPGTDNAAISTEVKVVENLKKENLSKEILGYDKFMERCWKWKEEYGNTIISQIKKLGASCDWSKERFTMDEGCSEAVVEFFVRLYEKGLIYKGNRIVNWCPNCKTTLSDIEVDYKPSEGDLVYLKYFVEDSSEFLTIATTRPETIFGDCAVAVNPNDERYSSLIGKSVVVPIINKKVPVIADEYVDTEFGTGVLKITPAHDFSDFDIGERHNLEKICIINLDGTLNNKCGKYSGLNTSEARKQIIDDLKNDNIVVKIEKIQNNVGKCSRCNHTIEPLTSDQWFVKMKQLAKPAIEAVENGSIKFVPERFSKIYMHWMKNIKDWCISRQIWWGHNIPAWTCLECNHINVSRSEVTKCSKCGSHNVKQTNDSLDTWFSSALWPFSVLGWPKQQDLLDKIYPDDVVITGYDIIFFWVSRMIFSSLELTNKIPFKYVVLHGLVRDSQGRKMSKSLGNGINPLDIISKYGADALRLSLVTGLTAGNDTRFSEDKLEGNRNFVNKIWNAARFLKMNGGKGIQDIDIAKLSVFDSWILSKLNRIIYEVTNNMEKFEFGLSLQKIYSFFWDDFCDWYLELSKISFKNNNSNIDVCCYVFCQILKILHPFIPFVTEEIWSFFNNTEYLMTSNYPKYDEKLENKNAERQVEKIISIVHTIRVKRNEMNTPNNKKITIYVKSNEKNEFFINASDFIEKLSGVSEVHLNCEIPNCEMVICALEFAEIMIPLEDLADKEILKSKMLKEISELEKRIAKNKSLLENKSFIEKAPDKVIENTKLSLKSDEIRLNTLKNRNF